MQIYIIQHHHRGLYDELWSAEVIGAFTSQKIADKAIKEYISATYVRSPDFFEITRLDVDNPNCRFSFLAKRFHLNYRGDPHAQNFGVDEWDWDPENEL